MKAVSTGTILTAGTKTTVYTVPTGYYAKWVLCYVVNTTGNNKHIDALWYDSSTSTEIHILDNYVLSPTQFIKFNDGAYVVLEEGDQVRLESESGSTMNAVNTFELYRKGE
jgi:hypothetical protein